MLRCSKCGRFVANITYEINEATDIIQNVKGTCTKCGIVEVSWDCYEDLVGWEAESHDE